MEYTAEIRDECGEWGEYTLYAKTVVAALESVWDYIHAHIAEGDYGQDESGGARVKVWVKLYDEDGDCVASEAEYIDIEPDHDKLIAAAGGDTACAHEWTSEDEGGCDQNPGVWAVGGTGMLYRSHCRRCGLRREEYHTGPQHNPGEADTVRYYMP